MFFRSNALNFVEKVYIWEPLTVSSLNCNTRPVRALQSKERLQYKYLGLKKPVVILKAICILERIVCICDSNLIILNQNDLEVISYGIKLKNISALTFNENPNNNNPFSVELCIARRKQLIVYNMTSEKFIP